PRHCGTAKPRSKNEQTPFHNQVRLCRLRNLPPINCLALLLKSPAFRRRYWLQEEKTSPRETAGPGALSEVSGTGIVHDTPIAARRGGRLRAPGLVAVDRETVVNLTAGYGA